MGMREALLAGGQSLGQIAQTSGQQDLALYAAQVDAAKQQSLQAAQAFDRSMSMAEFGVSADFKQKAYDLSVKEHDLDLDVHELNKRKEKRHAAGTFKTRDVYKTVTDHKPIFDDVEADKIIGWDTTTRSLKVGEELFNDVTGEIKSSDGSVIGTAEVVDGKVTLTPDEAPAPEKNLALIVFRALQKKNLISKNLTFKQAIANPAILKKINIGVRRRPEWQSSGQATATDPSGQATAADPSGQATATDPSGQATAATDVPAFVPGQQEALADVERASDEHAAQVAAGATQAPILEKRKEALNETTDLSDLSLTDRIELAIKDTPAKVGADGRAIGAEKIIPREMTDEQLLAYGKQLKALYEEAKQNDALAGSSTVASPRPNAPKKLDPKTVFLLQKKWAEVNAQIKRRGLDAASAETPAPPVAGTPAPVTASGPKTPGLILADDPASVLPSFMGDVGQDVLPTSFPVAGDVEQDVLPGSFPVADAPPIAAQPSATEAATPAAPSTPNKGSEYEKASQELYAQITEWEKAGIPANTIGDALASILKATITELNRNPNDVVLNARVTAISEIYNQWFSQNK